MIYPALPLTEQKLSGLTNVNLIGQFYTPCKRMKSRTAHRATDNTFGIFIIFLPNLTKSYSMLHRVRVSGRRDTLAWFSAMQPVCCSAATDDRARRPTRRDHDRRCTCHTDTVNAMNVTVIVSVTLSAQTRWAKNASKVR